MAPIEPEAPNPWIKRIEDTLADANAVREGLRDDEALPLMDWGVAQARVLGARMASPQAAAQEPEPGAGAEAQVDEKAYALVRLMTRITWVVTYRHKKDAAWLTRTFNKINDLSRELHGPDAPVLSDDEIAAWIATHAQHSNAELVQDLIARLTPGQPDDTQPPSPGPPGTAPVPPPSRLPGRGDPNE